jgi:SAM-dependent methyltransferase
MSLADELLPMKAHLLQLIRRPELAWLKQVAFFLRGVCYLGPTYLCPCCGWRVRGFLKRAGVVGLNGDGYCPRCNAKARHRRDWLYLREHTNLFTNRLRVLEVAPCHALARRLRRMRNLEFVGLDLDPTGESTTVAGDLAKTPLGADSVDAIICIHVLEHVEDDSSAIGEMFRVLRPGGWALVSVPLLTNELTREDPTITSAAERERVFGEKDHVRFYGTDFIDRLTAAGFQVRFDAGSEVTPEAQRRYGLRDDENVFYCIKPEQPALLQAAG